MARVRCLQVRCCELRAVIWRRLTYGSGPQSGCREFPAAAVPGVGRRRIADFLLFPDDRICWVPGAIRRGAEAIRRHKPRILYSTSPDPSAHLVALALARLMRLPWVAEFRDPWTMNLFRKPRPFAWMERAEHWMERRVVTNADHIVVTSAEYAADFCKSYPELDLGKLVICPTDLTQRISKECRRNASTSSR